MDKERLGEIVYVKPAVLDLGALTIVYGILCSSGGGALNCTAGPGHSGQGCIGTGNTPTVICDYGGNPVT